MASAPQAPESRKAPQVYQLCSICGQVCTLEGCVTDEHGRAVHEQCYADKLSGRLRHA